MILGNTFFDPGEAGSWTYRNGDLYLQNDYILIDKQLRCKMDMCGVCPEIDTGSDHRAIFARFRNLGCAMRRDRSQRRKPKPGVDDKESYAIELDGLLDSYALPGNFRTDRNEILEKVMVEAARM